MSNGIEVRFMQELDHQFFMPVFWMSCCEGRLEANILTNKCIIWGLEPRSVAWLIFMSLSRSQHRHTSQHPTREYQQGVKLYNLWGIFNIYSDHILNISSQCLIFWIPQQTSLRSHCSWWLFTIWCSLIDIMSSITCASPYYNPITHDVIIVTTLSSHDAGPGVGTQLSPGWQSTCPPHPLHRDLISRPGPGAAQAEKWAENEVAWLYKEMRGSVRMCVRNTEYLFRRFKVLGNLRNVMIINYRCFSLLEFTVKMYVSVSCLKLN